MATFHYIIVGQVQGVGFRPYIYRLAQQHQLTGWVKNTVGQVEIIVQGQSEPLNQFQQSLVAQAPPLAKPQILSCTACPINENLTQFEILASQAQSEAEIHVPPDYFICDDCLAELHHPQNRRYRYPFINCTQCGPRYTIIQSLPYDRPNTSMASFPLCADCEQEYHNPADRRFHAQPLACPSCGPQLTFRDKHTEIMAENALKATVTALHAGKIIAVKGIGGYHLICDANNDTAILRLRAHKPRPTKPLAVMLPLKIYERLDLNKAIINLLTSPKRPIVLVSKPQNLKLSPHIAPHLKEVGIMLPYSPLHHLLLNDFGQPLVATSANLSGEPVLTNNSEIEQRLSQVTEAFLHHNRPILRPADDAVFKIICQKPRPIRLGRGNAPVELELPIALEKPTLAVGGHLKNTIALGWGKRAVISPHIGELDSPRSLDVFQQVITDLQQLYQVQAERIVCDAHPQYASHRWAKQTGLPIHTVWHHHAHASALAGEFPQTKPWLIFTWDGVGLGNDGHLWGGETFYGFPGQWRRVGHLRPFYLPGGEKASRELWRCALAVCWEMGADWPQPNTELLYQAWQQRLNTPKTTAVGRLFDAAAALTGVLSTANFEGQGAMYLEALCQSKYDRNDIVLPITKNVQNLWEIDWAPLIPYLLSTDSSSQKAIVFHHSLAQAIQAHIQKISTEQEIGQIGLTGGVFQNRRLTETTVNLLQQQGWQVYLNEKIPCNDAGLSFGQLVEYGHMNSAILTKNCP